MSNTVEIKLTKEELKSELSRVLYEIDRIPSYDIDSQNEKKRLKRNARKLRKSILKLTPAPRPGEEMPIEDFLIHLNKNSNSERPEKRFFKEEGHWYNEEEESIIKKMIGNNFGFYNHILKNVSRPTDVKKIELERKKQEVESSNIYDKMCAPSETTYRYEFKVRFKWGQEPITVYLIKTENTTLSGAEVRAFM